jgi:hypothetical protein
LPGCHILNNSLDGHINLRVLMRAWWLVVLTVLQAHVLVISYPVLYIFAKTSNMQTGVGVDLRARLNIVVWTLLGSSGLFMTLRLYCKFLQKRRLWWDDYVLVAAWVRSSL